MRNTLIKHLESRQLDLKVHRAWLDTDVATFPLWNLSGKLAGLHQYRPDGDKKVNNDKKLSKYFTRVYDGKLGVWGLESWNFSNTLFVCEGLFDASKLTYRGKSAIATLANSVSPSLARWLWLVKQSRPVIVICDNDKSGQLLAKFGTSYLVVENYKDLGDAKDSYVDSICGQFN
jgi:hypothetical protein